MDDFETYFLILDDDSEASKISNYVLWLSDSDYIKLPCIKIDNTNSFNIIVTAFYEKMKDLIKSLSEERFDDNLISQIDFMIKMIKCIWFLIKPLIEGHQSKIPTTNYHIFGGSFPIHLIKYILQIKEIWNEEIKEQF